MKKTGILILLFWVAVNVYAESRVLPPVIDNSTYLNGSKSGVASPSTNSMFDVMSRMEQIQQELQELRGVVEEQSQVIDELKNRQNKIYSDLDQRIQELSGEGVVNNNPGNSNPSDSDGLNNDQSVGQTAAGYSQSEQDSKTSAVLPENQKEFYQDAFETLRNGHNTRAITKFKELLNRYPDGEFAANSLYWLGEAYKLNNDSESAKKAFSKVLIYYKDSSKVPDALYKLGTIELEQNKKDKAKDYLTRIVTDHPGSSSAKLAIQKLNKMELFQP